MNLRAATLYTGFKSGENKIKLFGSIIFLDEQDETEANWNSVLKKDKFNLHKVLPT